MKLNLASEETNLSYIKEELSNTSKKTLCCYKPLVMQCLKYES